jgi:hypothetical protein
MDGVAFALLTTGGRVDGNWGRAGDVPEEGGTGTELTREDGSAVD